jgi:uncharacterized protein (TIGR02284 family)
MHAANVDALNSLLRGEASAVETYNQAIAKFETESIATNLHRIRDEHQAAAVALREQVVRAGGTPANGSGAWGAFATAVSEAAEAVRPATVLAALKQGEQHGSNDYESALADPDLDPGCKDLIRSDLLPKSRAHVANLDRLLAGTTG